jgi:hypothetical protein
VTPEVLDEAVRLAEEAFIAELAKLVSHLTERLAGQKDGKPRIFRDSAVHAARGKREKRSLGVKGCRNENAGVFLEVRSLLPIQQPPRAGLASGRRARSASTLRLGQSRQNRIGRLGLLDRARRNRRRAGSAAQAACPGNSGDRGIPGRVERWRGGVGFGIFWVGVSPSVSQ